MNTVVKAQTGFLSEIAKDIVDRLPAVRAIILFGSYAKGQANSESDLDLLVLNNLDLGSQDDFDVSHVPLNGQTLEITLVPITAFQQDLKKGNPFALAVLRHGVELYDDGCVRELRDMAPPKPAREAVLAQVAAAKERLSRGDLRAAATYALNARRLAANNVEVSCHLERLSPPATLNLEDVEGWIREVEENVG